MKLAEIRKVRAREFLVLRVSATEEEQSDLAEVAAALSGYVNVPIVILYDDMDLESINAAKMRQLGWQRIEPVREDKLSDADDTDTLAATGG